MGRAGVMNCGVVLVWSWRLVDISIETNFSVLARHLDGCHPYGRLFERALIGMGVKRVQVSKEQMQA